MKIMLVVACLGAGCVVPTLESSDTQELLGDDGGGGSCPNWGCGSNTSNVGGIPFTDVLETGAGYNGANFRLVRFEKRDSLGIWRPYRAHVQMAQLLGLDLDTGQLVLQGAQLVGARFTFYNRDTGLYYYLTVEDVDRMLLWARAPGEVYRPTHTYRLAWTYRDRPMHAVNICGVNPDVTDNTPDFFAVLFEDDRVDPDAKKITGEQRDWFNIGCAGHALAKQHLLGHTKASNLILETTTTLAQRTANLKMIVADYCGRGHSFTVPGQPLLWKDEFGWYITVIPGDDIEARWTELGATCLNKPRVDYHPTELGSLTFPAGVEGLLEDPSLGCSTRPPACTGMATDTQGAHLITANG